MIIVPPDNWGIQKAVEILHNGGIVTHATETCYGFACDVSNPDAVARLFALKKRGDMPISVLFESIEQSEKCIEWNTMAYTIAKQYVPGPITMVLPAKQNASYQLFVSEHGIKHPNEPYEIGVRLSTHQIAQELVHAFGKPISTTSANISGLPNSYSPKDIQMQFHKDDVQPDIIIDSGPLTVCDASTVARITEKGVEVLRPGSIQL